MNRDMERDTPYLFTFRASRQQTARIKADLLPGRIRKEEHMKAGDRVYTPRFCTVMIGKVFGSAQEARAAGYREPTHYSGEYVVVGKSLDMYHMEFAAYKR